MALDTHRDEQVRIVPYNPAWPARFESEKELLERAIGQWVTGGIHHVGSTAVPGLAAKPVIDVLVGVRDLPSSRACFDELAKLGYHYAPYRSEEMHWFCKPSRAHRTYHLHMVSTSSHRYRAELTFRDVLRTRPDLAERYEGLKYELAAKYRSDREGYTDAKHDFVAEVLALSARADEVTQVTQEVAAWARSRQDIAAVALIGSWSRDAGRTDSDVDLILLSDEPTYYAEHDDWLSTFGNPPVARRQQWGVVAERRVRRTSGLEVEFGIAPPSWANTDPVDPGTRKVVQDGLRILADPRGLLAELVATLGA
jgi:GrpB-like predicted nucleotidyltransferase (UPF0157 family)